MKKLEERQIVDYLGVIGVEHVIQNNPESNESKQINSTL